MMTRAALMQNLIAAVKTSLYCAFSAFDGVAYRCGVTSLRYAAMIIVLVLVYVRGCALYVRVLSFGCSKCQ
jgi:hypothetical protein